ncbi:Short chain dehydrogenase family protein [Sphingomonas sp. 8AM]|nr:Short chain dehydrogenase family protein [Sphingomonas sp. 8AM]
MALAACGAQIILLARDPGRLEATRAQLGGTGHVTVAHSLDHADRTFDLIKDTTVRHGVLHGIFHAAGSYLAMPAKATRQKHIDAVFAASVMAAYGIARAAAHQSVLAAGGSVVFMSSVAGERGHPGTLAYAGAKAAIHGMVPVLAVELAPKKIRVNVITSGTVETEMHLTTAAGLPPALIEAGARRHLFGFGEPRDIGEAVVFLMSDAARWLTGTSLNVDGGYLAQ